MELVDITNEQENSTAKNRVSSFVHNSLKDISYAYNFAQEDFDEKCVQDLTDKFGKEADIK